MTASFPLSLGRAPAGSGCSSVDPGAKRPFGSHRKRREGRFARSLQKVGSFEAGRPRAGGGDPGRTVRPAGKEGLETGTLRAEMVRLGADAFFGLAQWSGVGAQVRQGGGDRDRPSPVAHGHLSFLAPGGVRQVLLVRRSDRVPGPTPFISDQSFIHPESSTGRLRRADRSGGRKPRLHVRRQPRGWRCRGWCVFP